MKKVYIIHGWTGNPEEGQLKWLREQLTQKGFEVIAPAMPDTDHPTIPNWVGYLSDLAKDADENTYFIGHSLGCNTILRYLGGVDKKIGGLVLIAGYLKRGTEDLGPEELEIAKPWMETPIDFEKVKQSTNKIVAVLSDNDPHVIWDINKKLYEEKLNAKVIVEHNKGHFTEEDGVFENPSALNALLDMAK